MNLAPVMRGEASRHAVSTVVLGAIIAIATWPIGSWTSWSPGLDNSFITGYHMAAQAGIRFGHQLAFTYGPLGFLAFPSPYLGWTSVLALAFAAITQWTLSIVLLSLARRAFPLWAAVGLAYLGARTPAWLGVPETIVVLAFIASVWLLGNRPARPRADLIVVAWGLLAGLSLLGKFNAGVVIASIAILTASQLVRPWWRGTFLAIVSTLTTALVIWLLMGQNLADIPPFLRLSIEEAAGYSSAMAVDAGPTLQWLLGDALITFVALAGLAWVVSRRWPLPMRVLLLVIGLGVAFATFKGAFVRWHYMIWFASAVPVTFVFMWDRRVRALSAAVLALMLATFLAAAGVSPVQFLDPLPQAATGVDQLRVVATPSLRHAALVAAMEGMQQGYPLDPGFLRMVRSHTVHIDPREAGVAFAFRDLRWQPLPVFQSYGAYTTALDEANADLDPHILSIPGTVGWGPPFDYPAPTRTISIGAGSNGRSSNDRLTIDFFSIPVAAP